MWSERQLGKNALFGDPQVDRWGGTGDPSECVLLCTVPRHIFGEHGRTFQDIGTTSSKGCVNLRNLFFLSQIANTAIEQSNATFCDPESKNEYANSGVKVVLEIIPHEMRRKNMHTASAYRLWIIKCGELKLSLSSLFSTIIENNRIKSKKRQKKKSGESPWSSDYEKVLTVKDYVQMATISINSDVDYLNAKQKATALLPSNTTELRPGFSFGLEGMKEQWFLKMNKFKGTFPNMKHKYFDERFYFDIGNDDWTFRMHNRENFFLVEDPKNLWQKAFPDVWLDSERPLQLLRWNITEEELEIAKTRGEISNMDVPNATMYTHGKIGLIIRNATLINRAIMHKYNRADLVRKIERMRENAEPLEAFYREQEIWDDFFNSNLLNFANVHSTEAHNTGHTYHLCKWPEKRAHKKIMKDTRQTFLCELDCASDWWAKTLYEAEHYFYIHNAHNEAAMMEVISKTAFMLRTDKPHCLRVGRAKTSKSYALHHVAKLLVEGTVEFFNQCSSKAGLDGNNTHDARLFMDETPVDMVGIGNGDRPEQLQNRDRWKSKLSEGTESYKRLVQDEESNEWNTLSVTSLYSVFMCGCMNHSVSDMDGPLKSRFLVFLASEVHRKFRSLQDAMDLSHNQSHEQRQEAKRRRLTRQYKDYIHAMYLHALDAGLFRNSSISSNGTRKILSNLSRAMKQEFDPRIYNYTIQASSMMAIITAIELLYFYPPSKKTRVMFVKWPATNQYVAVPFFSEKKVGIFNEQTQKWNWVWDESATMQPPTELRGFPSEICKFLYGPADKATFAEFTFDTVEGKINNTGVIEEKWIGPGIQYSYDVVTVDGTVETKTEQSYLGLYYRKPFEFKHLKTINEMAYCGFDDAWVPIISLKQQLIGERDKLIEGFLRDIGLRKMQAGEYYGANSSSNSSWGTMNDTRDYNYVNIGTRSDVKAEIQAALTNSTNGITKELPDSAITNVLNRLSWSNSTLQAKSRTQAGSAEGPVVAFRILKSDRNRQHYLLCAWIDDTDNSSESLTEALKKVVMEKFGTRRVFSGIEHKVANNCSFPYLLGTTEIVGKTNKKLYLPQAVVSDYMRTRQGEQIHVGREEKKAGLYDINYDDFAQAEHLRSLGKIQTFADIQKYRHCSKNVLWNEFLNNNSIAQNYRENFYPEKLGEIELAFHKQILRETVDVQHEQMTPFLTVDKTDDILSDSSEIDQNSDSDDDTIQVMTSRKRARDGGHATTVESKEDDAKRRRVQEQLNNLNFQNS